MPITRKLEDFSELPSFCFLLHLRTQIAPESMDSARQGDRSTGRSYWLSWMFRQSLATSTMALSCVDVRQRATTLLPDSGSVHVDGDGTDHVNYLEGGGTRIRRRAPGGMSAAVTRNADCRFKVGHPEFEIQQETTSTWTDHLTLQL